MYRNVADAYISRAKELNISCHIEEYLDALVFGEFYGMIMIHYKDGTYVVRANVLADSFPNLTHTDIIISEGRIDDALKPEVMEHIFNAFKIWCELKHKEITFRSDIRKLTDAMIKG